MNFEINSVVEHDRDSLLGGVKFYAEYEGQEASVKFYGQPFESMEHVRQRFYEDAVRALREKLMPKPVQEKKPEAPKPSAPAMPVASDLRAVLLVKVDQFHHALGLPANVEIRRVFTDHTHHNVIQVELVGAGCRTPDGSAVAFFRHNAELGMINQGEQNAG